MSDTITRHVIDNALAVASVDAIETSRTIASDQHDLPIDAQVILAEAICGTLLLATRLKGPGMLNLLRQGDGPFDALRCDAMGLGYIRSLVTETTHQKLAARTPGAPLLGPGHLQVQKKIADQEDTYTGTIEVDASGIAANISSYINQSEQTRGHIILDVQSNGQQLTRAKGLYIEPLPGAEHADDLLAVMSLRFGERPDGWGSDDVTTLIEDLAPGKENKFLKDYPVAFYCPCSRERYIGHLQGMAKKDLTELTDGKGVITATCDFCRTAYDIPLDEVI